MNMRDLYYKASRSYGLSGPVGAGKALAYARAMAKRYAEDVESLPYGKERTDKHDRLWPRYAKQIAYNPKSADSGLRWIENVSAGLRVKPAHDVARLSHTGWYVDTFESEAQHGVVVQLPARGGKPCFYPGVSDPYNDDCARVDFSGAYDDAEECARAADRMAEHDAEEQRQYCEADQLGRRYACIMEEAREARKNALQLISAFKADRAEGKTARPTVCAAIRDQIDSHILEWSRGKEKAVKLVDDLYFSPDSHVKEWRDLWNVFAESAGLPPAKSRA